jgi:glycosyltransferase involved in cell wall biosynthesis
MGLSGRCVFAGVRSDLPRLMMGAMDVVLFPSLWEGLGRALVEAQAAGLPCVASDVIPEEADVVRPLVRRLSLSEPASTWAEAVLAAAQDGPPLSQAEALGILEQSAFNIQRVVSELEELYRASTGRRGDSGEMTSP